MLVEDNAADVYLVKYALQQHGVDFELLHAKDGDAAVQMIRRVGTEVPRPDIVLLDMNLPRRTGAELLAILCGQPACAGIPVVVMTSSDSPDDRQRAADFNVAWYFRKPSGLSEFVQLGGIVKGLVLASDASAARTS